MKVAVTGANGNLGIRLVSALLERCDVVAIVRSGAARLKLQRLYPSLDVAIADYTSKQALTAALGQCEVVIHLVGIIKESSSNSFNEAHEKSCQSLVDACEATDVKKVIYLSIVGVDPQSSNTCLASKAKAEMTLQDADVDVTIIRVPMVLGEGDFASFALKQNASSRLAITFRSSSLEQPIYAGDVINAIMAAIEVDPITIHLAGQESITRKALIQRAATILHTSPMVFSVPIGIGMLVAAILELLPNPPVSRAMLGILDHDDEIDVKRGCELLNIELTSLDETLRQVLLFKDVSL